MHCTINTAVVLVLLSFVTTPLASVPDDMRTKLRKRDYWTDNCTYISKNTIYDIWEGAGGAPFYRNFHKDVDWDVMFTHPLSGHYNNLSLFFVNGLNRLGNLFDSNGYGFELVNIIGGCDDQWSTQEILITGTLKNGLKCDEVVVWNTRWDAATKRIRQVRTYVDSWFTTLAILGNEASTNSTWRTIRTDYIPGPYGMPNLTAKLGFPDGDSDLAGNYTVSAVPTTPFSELALSTDLTTYPTADATSTVY